MCLNHKKIGNQTSQRPNYMATKKSDYKWIDLERERRTTENTAYWIRGLIIIVGIVFALYLLQ